MKKFIFSVIALIAVTIYSYAQVTISNWDGTSQSFSGYPAACVITAPFTNPSATGINTSNNVMKVVPSSDLYDVAYTNPALTSYISFSSVNAVSVKVYSTVAGKVWIKLGKYADASYDKVVPGYYFTPGQWQEVKFNFYFTSSQNDIYNMMSIFADYEGTSTTPWYFDDIKTINIAPFSNAVITNFDDISRYFDAYDYSSTPAVAANPSSGGISINTTANCLKTVSSANAYENIVTTLESKLDFSLKNAISLMVYSDSIGIMTLKLRKPDGTNDIIQDYQYTAPGTWQKLTYNLTGTQSNSYNSITLYPNITNTDPNVNWYIDEMTFDSTEITTWQSHTIANFDNAKRLFQQWETNGVSYVANPNKSGINTSDNVMKILTSSGSTAEGAKTVLERNLDFISNNAITINVLASSAGNVLLKLQGNGQSDVIKQMSYTTPGSWQQLVFDLAGTTNNAYNLIALFPDIGGTNNNVAWYFDDIMITTKVVPPFDEDTIADFDQKVGFLDSWGTNGDSVVTNPNQSGINTSNLVLQVLSSSDLYEGVKNVLSSNISFASKNAISMKVLSDSMGVVHLKLQKNGNDSVAPFESDYEYTTPGQWQKLTFDLTGALNNAYDLIAIFPDIGSAANNVHWYIDDVTLDSVQIISFSGDTLANFDGTKRIFQQWETNGLSVVNNPNKSGINTTNYVLKVLSSTSEYEGTKDVRERKLNFENKNAISVHILSDSLGITMLKLSGPGASDIISKYQYTTPGNWQELTFDLTGAQSEAYNLIALFPAVGNKSANVAWYLDNITFDSVQIKPFASDTIANFDEAKRLFEGWDNIGFSTISNPYKTGINTSNTVMKVLTQPSQYEGIKTVLERKLDFSKSKSNILTIKVYSAATGTVHLKLQKEGDDNAGFVELAANYTTANQWQQLTFDISNATSNLYNMVAIFPDYGSTANNIAWYLDDLVMLHPVDLNPYSDWDGTTKTFNAVGNATFTAPLANPYQTGINTSNNVMSVSTTTQTDEGVKVDMGQYIDFSISSTFQIKVYSTVTGTVRVRLEGPGATTQELSTPYTTANNWQLLSFDFGTSIQTDVYKVVSILPDYGQSRSGIWYIDDITGPKLVNTPLVLDSIYANWETISPTLETWGSLSTSVATNPLIAGINQSAHVLQTTTNGSSTFEGFAINTNGIFDFSNGRSFALDVKSSVAGKVLLKLESPYTDAIQIPMQYTKPGSWQQLVYTFDNNAESKYNKISIFPDLDGTGTNQWYFDNIQGPLQIDTTIIYTGEISENHENGKTISATLVGDTFAANLDKTYWTASGLPSGVSIGSVTRVDNMHATITLSGNSSGNQSNDIIVSISVNKNQFVSNNKDLVNTLSIIAKGAFSQTRAKKVFAHYLPWFNTFPEVPGIATARDGWCQGSDCATNLSNIIYSNKPLIGEYNQFDKDVLEYQFLTMYGAGIDGIIININQSNAKEKAITMNALDKLKEMNEKYLNFSLKFIIAYDQKNTLADVYADFKYIRDSLTNNPKFSSFRFNDDKTGYPVILTWADFDVNFFNQCIDSVYNKQVIHIKRDASNFTTSDATFEWVNYLDKPATDHVYWGEDYFQAQETNLANQYKQFVPVSQRNYLTMGAAWPGFDDHNAPWNGGTPRWINRTVDAGETMALTFNRQINYVPGTAGPVMVELPWIQLVTWNDWSEGTSIEPATLNTYGYKPLKTIQTKIAQFEGNTANDTMALKLPYEIYQARKSGNTGLALCILDQFLAGNYSTAISTCNSGYTKFIPVTYRSEEDTNYSGAACAKMILDFEGTNATTQSAIQTYAVAHNYTSNIGQSFIDPFGMYRTLNNYEVVSAYNYAQLTRNNQSDAYKDMCFWMSYNIPNVDVSKMNMPATVPTGGNFNNWIIVNGFRASANPQQTSNYTVYGFYVMDPNVNGIGQNMFSQATSFGNSYFKPIVSSDIWNGKYVSVLEPPLTDNSIITIQVPQVSKFKHLNTKLRFEAVEESLRKSGLLINDANIVNAIKDSKWGRVYFVNLPGNVNDYYIVTFDKNGGCALAVIVDANNGALKDVSYVGLPDKSYYNKLSKKGIRMKTDIEESVGYNLFYPMVENISTAIDGIQDEFLKSGFDFEISPNPANGHIKLAISSSLQGAIYAEIYNISGIMVDKVELSRYGGNGNYPINIHGLEKGIYLVKVTLNSEIKIKKLIIE